MTRRERALEEWVQVAGLVLAIATGAFSLLADDTQAAILAAALLVVTWK